MKRHYDREVEELRTILANRGRPVDVRVIGENVDELVDAIRAQRRRMVELGIEPEVTIEGDADMIARLLHGLARDGEAQLSARVTVEDADVRLFGVRLWY